jgi:hypothetical protein
VRLQFQEKGNGFPLHENTAPSFYNDSEVLSGELRCGYQPPPQTLLIHLTLHCQTFDSLKITALKQREFRGIKKTVSDKHSSMLNTTSTPGHHHPWWYTRNMTSPAGMSSAKRLNSFPLPLQVSKFYQLVRSLGQHSPNWQLFVLCEAQVTASAWPQLINCSVNPQTVCVVKCSAIHNLCMVNLNPCHHSSTECL